MDLSGKSVWVGQDSLEAEGAQSIGIVAGSLIEIRGPLYRPDTLYSRARELTDEEQSAFAIPFKGHSIPKSIGIEYYQIGKKIDRSRHLPPLSINSA